MNGNALMLISQLHNAKKQKSQAKERINITSILTTLSKSFNQGSCKNFLTSYV